MKTFEITSDHIGIFNNYFGTDLCNKYITYFNEMQNKNLVKTRDEYLHNTKYAHEVQDTALDLYGSSFYHEMPIPYIAHEFNKIFWQQCYLEYSKKYSILSKLGKHNIIDVKIQKTKVGEGFHEWHVEQADIPSRNRVMAFMLYLNNVEQGGETEFLYQIKRIKPEADKLLIWPAGYTHVHRGNPPLSNDKYILTGWIEYC